jgi:hypothetical protein
VGDCRARDKRVGERVGDEGDEGDEGDDGFISRPRLSNEDRSALLSREDGGAFDGDRIDISTTRLFFYDSP